MRSQFGSIVGRKNKQGEIVSLLAKYQDPTRPGQVITKIFPLGQRAFAQQWLDNEQKVLDAARAGETQWTTPAQREQQNNQRFVTFAKYATDFVENYKVSGQPIRNNSMRAKRNQLKHLVEYFGDRKLNDITSTDTREIIDYLVEISPSGSGARATYSLFKAILRRAFEEDEIIDRLPRFQQLPKVKKHVLSDIATPDQLKTIYDAMPEASRISILLAGAWGLRIEEVCALQLDDFNLTKNTVHIQRGLQRSNPNDTGALIAGEAKNEVTNRVVPIPDNLMPILKNHIAKFMDAKDPEARVLKSSEAKARYLSTNALRQQYNPAREKAKRPDLRFHDIRGTVTTTIKKLGGSTRESMAIVGHTANDIESTTYDRATPERIKYLIDENFNTLFPWTLHSTKAWGKSR